MFKGFHFVAKISLVFILHRVLLKPSLFLWMSVSLFSPPGLVCAHTQPLALSPPEFDFKSFHSFIFILQWVFIFGGDHWQRKKEREREREKEK